MQKDLTVTLIQIWYCDVLLSSGWGRNAAQPLVGLTYNDLWRRTEYSSFIVTTYM